jgi:glycosyltransferase involved in cell wall biosynthesis
MLKVIINGYNSSEFLKKCLQSVKNQTFKNYKCIIVNDASTEEDFEIYAKEYPEFSYIKNDTNLGPLASRVVGINNMNCSDNDIIFLIDGDDWLIHENVFQYIYNIYQKEDILLTWGYWKPIDTSGKQVNRENGLDGVYIPRMKFIDHNRKKLLKTNSYRNVPFSFSHPRTFKYILWENIDQKDFLDKNGNIFRSATDYAFMYPMIEMCNDRFKIIYERLIYYNLHDNNIVQKSKKDEMQNRIWCNEIKNKKKYKPIF